MNNIEDIKKEFEEKFGVIDPKGIGKCLVLHHTIEEQNVQKYYGDEVWNFIETKLTEQREKIKIEVLKDDTIPAFGGYTTGSLKDGKAIMVLNVDAVINASKAENIEQKEIIVQSLMHEFGHALQEYLDMEYSEELMEKSTDIYLSQQREKGEE